jgi:thiamine-phosphate pyrophosphorylase
MTDERIGDGLWAALAALPRGSGVVVRHYGLSQAERRALLARVERLGRERGLVVLGAGLPASGGVHNGRSNAPGLRTRSVHHRREAVAAARAGADCVFVSPVFATRSHAAARPLGPVRLGLLTRGLPMPVIALGGMNASRLRRLGPLRVHGWAGIDAWLR